MLESGAGITKWGKGIKKWGKGITKWGRDYKVGQRDYKMGQGLQSWAGITKWCSTTLKKCHIPSDVKIYEVSTI